jgi:hypothetical protein
MKSMGICFGHATAHSWLLYDPKCCPNVPSTARVCVARRGCPWGSRLRRAALDEVNSWAVGDGLGRGAGVGVGRGAGGGGDIAAGLDDAFIDHVEQLEGIRHPAHLLERLVSDTSSPSTPLGRVGLGGVAPPSPISQRHE